MVRRHDCTGDEDCPVCGPLIEEYECPSPLVGDPIEEMGVDGYPGKDI